MVQSASLAKMQALTESLRASMPESDDVKPLSRGTDRSGPGALHKRSGVPSGSGSRLTTLRRQAASGGAGASPADVAQLAADYDEVRSRYEDTLRENESLKADARRRIESSMRREQKYEEDLKELRGEVDRKEAPTADASVEKLRTEHRRVLQGVSALKERTASVLAEQERDLLRAFRARLYDVQIELEQERSKKDDGALEWIEKSRSLGKELDWSREEALRLDRVNQFLQKEATRLKATLKSHEGDRELLARQMLTLKKAPTIPPSPPARRRPAEISSAEIAPREVPEVRAMVAQENARLKRALEMRPASASAAPAPAPAPSLGPSGASEPNLRLALDSDGNGDLNAAQRISELTTRQAEAESRYREVVARLKRLLEVERRNLRAVRQAHARDLQSRTELEGMLRACVDDVRRELAARSSKPGSRPASSAGGPRESNAEMAPADRERVLELLLSQALRRDLAEICPPPRRVPNHAHPSPSAAASQERVVTLLYDRTFPPRNPGDGVGVEAEPIAADDAASEVDGPDLSPPPPI